MNPSSKYCITHIDTIKKKTKYLINIAMIDLLFGIELFWDVFIMDMKLLYQWIIKAV